MEGIRLANIYPQAQLIISGGGYEKTTNSALMYKTAISLGINKNRIVQNPNAMDTAQEAAFLASKLVDYNTALVTSVSHMPRAINLFNAQGVAAIPAATDYHNFAAYSWYKQLIPNAKALLVVTQFAHEVVGDAWIKIRRTINPEAL